MKYIYPEWCPDETSRTTTVIILVRLSCCCCAYLSSSHQTASDANLLDDPHTFHYQDYFVIGGITK